MSELGKELQKIKNELDELPSDLSISTATITCKTDIIYNVENIGLYFNDFDDIIIGKKYGNRIVSDIINVKENKTKKEEKSKKNFYNQVSLIINSAKLHDAKYVNESVIKTINVKLFINGSIQMTGCKQIQNVEKTLILLFNKLKSKKAILNNNKFEIKSFISDSTDIKFLDIKYIRDFQIRMINTNFNIEFKIKRQQLHEILLANNIDSSYDPINHACINVKYTIPNSIKTVSMFVFESGAITIAGANNCYQVIQAYNFINKIILSNYYKVMSKSITPQVLVDIIKNFNNDYAINTKIELDNSDSDEEQDICKNIKMKYI